MLEQHTLSCLLFIIHASIRE